ncbi:acetyl-CoA decarbonylase/synthase complex subunit gamma [Desulfomonile tiedjei]|uniref:CO dehydrogenase/acetyl-CoA synthase gamma subunit (Corrinoid Fe-S protein) n=1 Tax=Desulfomonile tiedjei (strain ATCC 49306 / DSM 6799 / DCB-1) TaxID=706587 RepID=I4C085_DESTA|nr:acetyl-CoA decarbonylase/synthase complex subunit gamma [Desulfomonile tiedjei]AFM22976.1 CO dehydrogenase/acetyl-CoA synthase gamma subunit (corrinoid Fe-S protein) [Desulfomonile tiedjei DSM 6799]
MALSGIQIFKMMPKKNCGECGVPTCLAFAMNLAAGKAELAQCPYVSDEAKEKLASASAPPIRTVQIGVGDSAVKTGGETVLFRHEKTFNNPTALGCLIATSESDASVDGKLKAFKELRYERVGLTLKPDLIAVKDAGDPTKFAAIAKKASDAGAALVLISDNLDALKAALAEVGKNKPLVYAATAANVDAISALCKEYDVPVAIKASKVGDLATMSASLMEKGHKDIVLDSGSRDLAELVRDNIMIRRLALEKLYRPLGFPTIVFPCEMADNPVDEAIIAGTFISKYGGIAILSDLKGELLFPLLLQRLNIFTDPQRPMTTEQGIYPINNPGEDSPVLITSNFSLTYFIVSGEVEASRVPSWLLVLNTDGLSVLTAWAAGKFVADLIGPFVKKSGIEEKTKTRKLIIPGAAAIISGDLEEELQGWGVAIGPREGAHIPAYLRQNYA